MNYTDGWAIMPSTKKVFIDMAQSGLNPFFSVLTKISCVATFT